MPQDIENCLDEFYKGGSDVVITVTEAQRSPWFNMVKKENGLMMPIIPIGKNIVRRQDAPQVFDMTTVAYVAKPSFVLSALSIFSGRVRAVHVPVERAIDIDTLLDFEIAEFLIKRHKKRL